MKNKDYYYCCYPQGRRECIEEISCKIAEGDKTPALSNCLYSPNMNLGESLFDGIEYASKLLSESFDGKEYRIEPIYKYRPLGDNLLFYFVWESFLQISAFDINDLFGLDGTTKIYKDFLEECIKDANLCSLNKLKEFCIKNCLPLIGPRIVGFDGQEYMDNDVRIDCPNNIELVDRLLNHQHMPQTKRDALRKKLPIYSDDFISLDLFNKLIDEEKISRSGLFEYHVYELHTLQDLFSAVLWEIFDAGRIIKKCKHCDRFFATPHRTDSEYCGRPSPKNPNLSCAEEERYERKLMKERLSREVRNAYRRALRRIDSNKCLSDDDIHFFYREKEKLRTAVLRKEITMDEFIAWLDSYGRKE